MIEFIGYVSGLLFALCGVPQAYQCYKQGHAEGVSGAFVWMWLGGEVGTILYVVDSLGFIGPLMLNYLTNLATLFIIMYYMYFPRSKK